MRERLKLNIESTDECKALITLVSDYESKMRNKDIPKDISVVISDIVSATDIFRIKKSFDLIGPVTCSKCSNHWVAILSKKLKDVECPKCGFTNAVKEMQKNKWLWYSIISHYISVL